MAETGLSIIQRYPAGRYNVLVPTSAMEQISPWHAVRVSEVQANPDPNSGDVFKVGSRWDPDKRVSLDLFSPAKPLLMKIAAAAGIVWNWRESGPETIQRDYICYKAVGAVRLPDGSWQPIMARKEIDLGVIEEEIREQWTAKAESLVQQGGLNKEEQLRYRHRWQEVSQGGNKEPKNTCFLDAGERERYIEDHVRSALIQWRKNKLGRAETGAMLRVIRAALGMKAQYTREELERPFVVPRIDFSPNYSDPEVRHALIQHGVAAMAGLFGQAQPAAPAAIPASMPNSGGHVAFQPPIEADAFDDDGFPGGSDGPGVEPHGDGDGADAYGEQPSPPPVEGEPEQPSLLDQAAGSHVCEEPGCGTSITEKVATYSRQRHGRSLCYKHQPGRQNGGRGA